MAACAGWRCGSGFRDPELRRSFLFDVELASRLVFITGDIANEETAATLRRTGAPCVEKPFRVHEFISVVEQTLGRAAS